MLFFSTKKLYLHLLATRHINKILLMSKLECLPMKALFSSDNSVSSAMLVSKDPLKQFENWHDYACNVPTIAEPNAMVLATVKPSGEPSARVVLLQEYCPDGFKFHSHAKSSKAKDIEKTPYAAVVFLWIELCRSIRIEGDIKKVSLEKSNALDIDGQSQQNVESELFSTYLLQPDMIEFWQWQRNRSNDKIVFQRNVSTEKSDFHAGENAWFYRIAN